MNALHKKLALILLGFSLPLVILAVFHANYRKAVYDNSLRVWQANNKILLQNDALSEDLLRKVGWFKTFGATNKSSYLNRPPEKPDTIFRIGAFGCSSTQGAEVIDGLEYPSLLQKELERRSHNDIEVINFGVGCYGFFQSYMLWEALSEVYELDCILIGPFGFYTDRDSSFDRSPDHELYLALHARYIIDDNSLKLVELAGNNYEEIIENYLRLIPRWRYLRYDYISPAVIRSISPGFKARRNPFYYRPDMKTEIFQIYKKLLRKITDNSERFILLNPDERRVNLVDSEPEHSYAGILYERRAFPYLAEMGHHSGFGNALVAEQYANAFEGRHSGNRYRVLTFNNIPDPGKSSYSDALPLGAYDDVSFTFRGKRFARFVRINEGVHPNLSSFSNSVPHNALAAVKQRNNAVTDALFFPLHTIPKTDSGRVKARHIDKTVTIGELSRLHPSLNIFTVNIEHTPARDEVCFISRIATLFEEILEINSKNAEIEILHEGRRLFRFTLDTEAQDRGSISASPAYYIIRPMGNAFLANEDFKEGDILYLDLLDETAGWRRSFPFAESGIKEINH